MGQNERPHPLDAVVDVQLAEGRSVLVVDGDCALCSWAARLIARRDADDRFRLVACQTPLGRRLLAQRGLDPDDPESWLMIDADGFATDADAMLAVGRRLSGPCPWIARVAAVAPRRLRAWAYRRLARNRRALFGRGDLCAAPTPELRARLIDAAALVASSSTAADPHDPKN